jgi:NAD-dependent dihydropyrimidine dehydrogenase PreA subunit
MAYVIAQSCCCDASCVEACPVDCIHPTPNEAGFADAEILYIDPLECIDCDACAEACPVSAISMDTDLPPDLRRYAEINAGYYTFAA